MMQPESSNQKFVQDISQLKERLWKKGKRGTEGTVCIQMGIQEKNTKENIKSND